MLSWCEIIDSLVSQSIILDMPPTHTPNFISKYQALNKAPIRNKWNVMSKQTMHTQEWVNLPNFSSILQIEKE